MLKWFCNYLESLCQAQRAVCISLHLVLVCFFLDTKSHIYLKLASNLSSFSLLGLQSAAIAGVATAASSTFWLLPLKGGKNKDRIGHPVPIFTSTTVDTILSRSNGGLRATEIEPTLSPHHYINRERTWRCPSDCKGDGSTNVTTME